MSSASDIDVTSIGPERGAMSDETEILAILEKVRGPSQLGKNTGPKPNPREHLRGAER